MRIAAIILPTYNESKNIPVLIDKLIEVNSTVPNWELHTVVVDSDSPDETGRIVEDIYNSDTKKYRNLHIVKTRKEGLGKAYIEGFTTAMEKIQPYVLFQMDADLSHNPDNIPDFLEKIEKGADFVIGSRYSKGGSIPHDWALYRKLLSVIGNYVIKFGFMKLGISDWTSGFRAMRVWVLKKSLDKVTNYTGYVFQVALLDNAVKSGARIEEVPIQFVDRREGASKINSIQYTLQTLFYVFQYSAFIKFCIVGGIGFIVDFALSYLFIDFMHTAVWLATVISAESAIISNFLFNNFWSFSHKKVENNLIGSFLKFNSIALGSIIIQAVGMEFSSNMFGKELWPLYKFIIIICVIIPYSYILYNKFVWKNK